MSREELILESWRFTSVSAMAREIEALLENSTYKLVIQVRPREIEELSNLCESFKTLGRVSIVRWEPNL